jgi:hypothetical protein
MNNKPRIRTRVEVHMTPKQEKRWRAAAKKAGLTLPEFIRQSMRRVVDA